VQWHSGSAYRTVSSCYRWLCTAPRCSLQASRLPSHKYSTALYDIPVALAHFTMLPRIHVGEPLCESSPVIRPVRRQQLPVLKKRGYRTLWQGPQEYSSPTLSQHQRHIVSQSATPPPASCTPEGRPVPGTSQGMKKPPTPPP